jgi:lysophospholipase L1-like esterase
VGLITLSIGGNDLLKCNLFGESNATVLQKCFEASLSELASNLATIVLTLQATSPNIPIVAMNLYQPFVALWLNGKAGQAMVDLTMAATTALNDVLDNVYGALQVPVVNAAEAFGTFIYKDGGAGPDPPTNVRLVCQWTNMCEMQESGELVLLGDYDDTTLDVPRPDIHPNNEGYEVLADAHISLIKEMNLIAKAAPH